MIASTRHATQPTTLRKFWMVVAHSELPRLVKIINLQLYVVKNFFTTSFEKCPRFAKDICRTQKQIRMWRRKNKFGGLFSEISPWVQNKFHIHIFVSKFTLFFTIYRFYFHSKIIFLASISFMRLRQQHRFKNFKLSEQIPTKF